MHWSRNKESLLAQFQRDGFVAIPAFFDQDDMRTIHARLHRLIEDVVPNLPRDEVFYEDKDDPSTLKQIQSVERHDPFFRQLMFESSVPDLAKCLLEDDVSGMNLQYFNKAPGTGQPTPPHQDGYYFKLSPCEAITIWVALETVTEENGCVRYVRGSHTKGMRPHGQTGTLGFSQGITDFGLPEDVANEVTAPAESGTLLAHHAMTIHRADRNASATRSRRALGFVYYAAHAQEDLEAKHRYQAELKSQWTRENRI